jgi:two-component system LytT family sensor kinase
MVMQNIDLDKIIDQRRLLPHIAIIIISMLTIAFSVLVGKYSLSLRDLPGLAVLIFIYLEAFIFLARKIFRNLGADTTSKEFLRKILSRFLIFYIACFFSAMIIFILFRYFINWLNDFALTGVIYNFFHAEFNSWFKPTIKGLSFGAVIFLFIQWTDALKRERKLKEESLIFQNETLKNQINPHFLFNSLNTVSSLISTNPEVAERFVSKLSSIYRYILENSHKNKVSLKSELAFISDYFELYKIRDEEKILLSIDAPGADNFWIIPVSLQILMENAIKHNMATRENPLKISIYIENQYIIVKNNLQKMALKLKSTKIGLKNLAERIKLITGEELVIEETNTDFIVKLSLLS